MNIKKNLFNQFLIWTILPITFLAFSLVLVKHILYDRPAYSLYEPILAKNKDEKTRVMNSILDATLARIDSAVLIRMSAIQSLESTSNMSPHYTWSVVAARAAKGFTKGPGPFVANLPISNWSAYLQSLLERKCSHQLVARQPEVSSRQRLAAMGVSEFDVCPVFVKSELRGALFVFWPDNRPPQKPESYFGHIQRTADVMAFFLSGQKVNGVNTGDLILHPLVLP